MISSEHRYLGCLLGLACGDAVGTLVKFAPHSELPNCPYGLKSHDISIALGFVENLLDHLRFDTVDDIQDTVRLWAEGREGPLDIDNGSLMRLFPLALWFHPDTDSATAHAARSSLTTPAAPETVDCCRLLAAVICNALAGKHKDELLAGSLHHLTEPKARELAEGRYQHKRREQMCSSGTAVQSLEAALWCVHVTDSLEQAILAAANFGDGANTVAAITGQIAGALYGEEGIPRRWLAALPHADLIADLAQRLQRVKGGAP